MITTQENIKKSKPLQKPRSFYPKKAQIHRAEKRDLSCRRATLGRWKLWCPGRNHPWRCGAPFFQFADSSLGGKSGDVKSGVLGCCYLLVVLVVFRMFFDVRIVLAFLRFFAVLKRPWQVSVLRCAVSKGAWPPRRCPERAPGLRSENLFPPLCFCLLWLVLFFLASKLSVNIKIFQTVDAPGGPRAISPRGCAAEAGAVGCFVWSSQKEAVIRRWLLEKARAKFFFVFHVE